MGSKDRPAVPDPLAPAVGALIFASDEPVHPKEIASALGGVEVAQVEEALTELDRLLEDRGLGLSLEHIAGGVRFATRPEFAPWVRVLFQERNRTRLSFAALETLAIVAYRQPVTAPEIQAIRGKDPVAALKGLLDKKLVRCLGRKKVVGSPLLYGTPKEFLVHFGLNTLEDLPSIEEFDQFMNVLDARIESVADHEPSAADTDAPPAP
jgi:segregation and condensation protein B